MRPFATSAGVVQRMLLWMVCRSPSTWRKRCRRHKARRSFPRRSDPKLLVELALHLPVTAGARVRRCPASAADQAHPAPSGRGDHTPCRRRCQSCLGMPPAKYHVGMRPLGPFRRECPLWSSETRPRTAGRPCWRQPPDLTTTHITNAPSSINDKLPTQYLNCTHDLEQHYSPCMRRMCSAGDGKAAEVRPFSRRPKQDPAPGSPPQQPDECPPGG